MENGGSYGRWNEAGKWLAILTVVILLTIIAVTVALRPASVRVDVRLPAAPNAIPCDPTINAHFVCP